MERIFNQMYAAFQGLMITGQMLFDWLVTPLDDEIFVSTIGAVTPMELVFGGSIIVVLAMWLTKFIVR